MRKGLVLLCLAYVLSQFFRAFLAVLTQLLQDDIGATADDLAFASGMLFLSFAAMQIPVGEALDRVGPRLTAAVLLAVGGGGGAALFAMATSPLHIALAMALIGAGCAPVLMASYYIFARVYPARMFATLGAVMIGVGSVGNIASASPFGWVVASFGWRETLWLLSGLSVLVALGLWLRVEDPPKVAGNLKGSVLDVLKIRALWPILPLILVSYAPAAGVRGLWVSPFLGDVYGAPVAALGTATLIMGVAMIVGTFAYGPLDRLFGTRKWVIFGGNVVVVLACGLLAARPGLGYGAAVALCAAIGMFGLTFPVIMAHGRSFIPAHLTGRGVTLMNLFSIGGVGLMQVFTGRLHAASAAASVDVAFPYQMLFGFFAVVLGAGMVVYLFAQDRLD